MSDPAAGETSERPADQHLIDIALGYAAKLAGQGIELPEGMPPDSIIFGELPPPRTAERPEWPTA
ncbi:MAG TPA: hypothetical protein VIZ43_08560 [Trebonia sp.]